MSLRTVELLPFSEAETRLLLTEPMRHSELWQDDEASRPRFDAASWGEGGIERIHHETAGWPHLVQLVAERVVYLVNLRGLRACTLEVLDEAIAAAIASGDAVLRQLVYSESRLAGEWEYLKGFRTHDFQEPPADEAVYQSLRRRLMVTEEEGRWRMRVPLMQRWGAGLASVGRVSAPTHSPKSATLHDSIFLPKCAGLVFLAVFWRY